MFRTRHGFKVNSEVCKNHADRLVLLILAQQRRDLDRKADFGQRKNPKAHNIRLLVLVTHRMRAASFPQAAHDRKTHSATRSKLSDAMLVATRTETGGAVDFVHGGGGCS